MNILLKNKIKEIPKAKSTRYILNYKNIIPLIAITGFGIYSYRKRRKAFVHKKKKLKISKALSSYFHNILKSDEIKRDSISLVNNVFSHSSTKKALCELIKGALDDKEISLSLKSFASSMLIDFIRDKSIKEQIIRNMIVVMQNKELKKESIELLKDFLDYPNTKEAFIGYCKEVAMKEEIKEMFTNLIIDSAINTMKMPEIKKKGAEFIADIWSDPIVRWNMFKRSILFWQTTPQSTESINNGNTSNVKH